MPPSEEAWGSRARDGAGSRPDWEGARNEQPPRLPPALGLGKSRGGFPPFEETGSGLAVRAVGPGGTVRPTGTAAAAGTAGAIRATGGVGTRAAARGAGTTRASATTGAVRTARAMASVSLGGGGGENESQGGQNREHFLHVTTLLQRFPKFLFGGVQEPNALGNKEVRRVCEAARPVGRLGL